MNIYLGADHRGFALKEALKPWLSEQGHTVIDCGNQIYDKDDDFPDFAFPVADRVAAEPVARGVLICGSGVGICVAANKVKGVRCALTSKVEEVESARQHSDANVMALSADYIDQELAKQLVSIFLKTAFIQDERYQRRLDKIAAREQA